MRGVAQESVDPILGQGGLFTYLPIWFYEL